MLLRGADPNKTDCDGKTPLHFIMNLFSRNGTVSGSITDLLVIYGANVNAKDNENWTPL
jgi:ankyrin repeat protein